MQVVPKARGDVGVWLNRMTGSSKVWGVSLLECRRQSSRHTVWTVEKHHLGGCLCPCQVPSRSMAVALLLKCITEQPQHTCFFNKASLFLTVRS